jgi:hypothetical protein
MRTDRQIDRQTDMTKLIIAFRNFANVSKKYVTLIHYTYVKWTDLSQNMEER